MKKSSSAGASEFGAIWEFEFEAVDGRLSPVANESGRSGASSATEPARHRPAQSAIDLPRDAPWQQRPELIFAASQPSRARDDVFRIPRAP